MLKGGIMADLRPHCPPSRVASGRLTAGSAIDFVADTALCSDFFAIVSCRIPKDPEARKGACIVPMVLGARMR